MDFKSGLLIGIPIGLCVGIFIGIFYIALVRANRDYDDNCPSDGQLFCKEEFMKDKIFMLKPCIRCGGHAEFRHIKIKGLWYLIKFHFHPNQYWFICERCGAKIACRHKIELAVNDWNEQN